MTPEHSQQENVSWLEIWAAYVGFLVLMGILNVIERNKERKRNYANEA